MPQVLQDLSGIDVSQALQVARTERLRRTTDGRIPAPRALDIADWPPDYDAVHAWRAQQLDRFELQPQLVASARAYYAQHPIEWICHWCDTYDPRNVGSGKPVQMPLVLFRRQEELVRFFLACMEADAHGLVEKSRDMGATWVGVSFSLWLWLFHPGSAVGWGSNKLDQVDALGEPDTIFEKMRAQLRLLPDVFRPDAREGVHLKHGICYHPEHGSVVRGQGGTNIGRGGRSRIYFVDEAAHLDKPDAAEASLSANTRCRVDISSVSGLGTVFQRKREAGQEWEPGQPLRRDVMNVFVMDWRDHPEKTREWYAEQRRFYEAQGSPHVVAREYDRDYAAAVEGIIIPYEHVEAAVDAHQALGFDDSGGWGGGLDVADTGGDTNALVRRRGAVVCRASEWGERDPGATARRAFQLCRETCPIELQYDSIGIGTNVKSEINRLLEDGVDVEWLSVVPWNAGAAVLNPMDNVIPGDRKSPRNRDFFRNLKAQAWWEVAQFFRRTWAAREEGAEYSPDQLISLDSAGLGDILPKLMRELSQATAGRDSRLRMIVEKAPSGSKSPNLADALVMCRWPARPPARPRGSRFGPRMLRG